MTMLEILSEWVILGPMRVTYGSFNNRDRAEEYADAIRRLRCLPCSVVHRDSL